MSDPLDDIDLRIGRGDHEIRLTDPLIASPMAGVIDPPYRMILHDLGIQLSFTEMISARGSFEGSVRTLELAGWVPRSGHSGAQIFGSDPWYLGPAAVRMVSLGHHLIDINAGCPKRKVIGQGSGGALLKEPERMIECVASVLDSVDVPVGIKTRSGFSGFERQSYLELMKDLEGMGLSYISIHPRTVMQGFKGKADRGVIDLVSSKIDIPLLASGDVRTSQDVRDYQSRGADAVLIGRALMGDPFRTGRMRFGNDDAFPGDADDVRDIFRIARDHLERTVSYYGERRGIVKFRTHLGWYMQGFRNRSILRDRIFHVTTTEETLTLMEEAEDSWVCSYESC